MTLWARVGTPNISLASLAIHDRITRVSNEKISDNLPAKLAFIFVDLFARFGRRISVFYFRMFAGEEPRGREFDSYFCK